MPSEPWPSAADDVVAEPSLARRLVRRDAPKPAPAGSCGPQCIMLIAGAAAGVLLAVLLVLGVLIYRRRRAQEDEDEMLAEMEDDWRFQPRTMSVSAQGRKFSTRTAGRKQSVAGGAPWSAGGAGYSSSYPSAAGPMVLNGPVGRAMPGAHRPSLTPADAASGLHLPRRPSRADLAQMEVYRKMSVIGIV